MAENRLSLEEIKQILPHRDPFLMIDEVTDYEPGQYAVAIKKVTGEEEFFKGHFPGNPIMPGVMIIEALAQTGAVGVLTKEENRGKIALFGGIKDARFKRKVVPGDTLSLRVDIVADKGIVGVGKGEAYVGEELAAKVQFMFAIDGAE